MRKSVLGGCSRRVDTQSLNLFPGEWKSSVFLDRSLSRRVTVSKRTSVGVIGRLGFAPETALQTDADRLQKTAEMGEAVKRGDWQPSSLQQHPMGRIESQLSEQRCWWTAEHSTQLR